MDRAHTILDMGLMRYTIISMDADFRGHTRISHQQSQTSTYEIEIFYHHKHLSINPNIINKNILHSQTNNHKLNTIICLQ